MNSPQKFASCHRGEGTTTFLNAIPPSREAVIRGHALRRPAAVGISQLHRLQLAPAKRGPPELTETNLGRFGPSRSFQRRSARVFSAAPIRTSQCRDAPLAWRREATAPPIYAKIFCFAVLGSIWTIASHSAANLRNRSTASIGVSRPCRIFRQNAQRTKQFQVSTDFISLNTLNRNNCSEGCVH